MAPGQQSFQTPNSNQSPEAQPPEVPLQTPPPGQPVESGEQPGAPPQSQPQPVLPAQPQRHRLLRWSKWHTLALIVLIAVIAAVLVLGRNTLVSARTWVVAPNGSATSSGEDAGSATSLQSALDRALPGDVIQLQAGVYKPSAALQTKRDGEASRPITIKGPESGLDMSQRNKAVIMGRGHVFDVDHSYYVFEGFTINGQPNLAFNDIPTTPQEIMSFKDKNQSKIVDGRLIYVGNKARDVKGTVINNMFLTGAGGECVRMRNFTTGSKITNSLIYRCGFLAKEKDYRYHNGEGVYIGTSTRSTDQPYYKDDQSNNNLVQNNIIQTFASECVNIKENAAYNIIDGNQCLYGLGPETADESILEVRGKNNQVTNNVIQHSSGYGIKLWSDGTTYGGNNIIAKNKLSDIHSYVVTVKGQPQPKEVCETTYAEATALTFGMTDTDIAKKCSQSYPTGLPSGSGSSTPAPSPTPAPQITSLSPSSGPVQGGTSVTIKVSNLPSGTPTVTFGGTAATKITRSSTDTITATTPARSQTGSVPVIVQVGDKACSSVFTYTAATSGDGSTGGSGSTAPTPTPTPTPAPTGGILFSDNFANFDNITKVRGGSWKISGEKELQLADPKDDLSVGNSNIAIVNKSIPKDYMLTVQAKTKGTDSKFNDFSIIFDYADQKNYSFVSFNESNDNNTSGVFEVTNGVVAQVADIITLIKADQYVGVGITHTSDGLVKVVLNGQQVSEVKMTKQHGSQIGFGTRNDSARFDDLVVKQP